MKGDITKIYGVNLVGSQDPNALVRTNAAQGLKIKVDTNSEITSDFDNCYPWSDNLEMFLLKFQSFIQKSQKIRMAPIYINCRGRNTQVLTRFSKLENKRLTM